MSVVGAAVVGQTTLSNAGINNTGIDGHATGTVANTTSGTLTLTTTKIDDYLILFVTASNDVVNVSDTANLTWSIRGHNHNPTALSGSLPMHCQEWTAYSVGTLSGDIITVSFSANTNAAMVVAAVSGAFNPIPFDPYAISTNIVNSTTTPSSNIVTANPTGILLGMFGWSGGSGASFTAGSGYTAIASVTQSTNIGVAIEYQLVSVAEVAFPVTATLGASENTTIITDALMSNEENIYVLLMPTNNEATLHHIYFDNGAGLVGTPSIVLGIADTDIGSEAFLAPIYNGSYDGIHIHITSSVGVLFVNTSLTDQYRIAWNGLRTL